MLSACRPCRSSSYPPRWHPCPPCTKGPMYACVCMPCLHKGKCLLVGQSDMLSCPAVIQMETEHKGLNFNDQGLFGTLPRASRWYVTHTHTAPHAQVPLPSKRVPMCVAQYGYRMSKAALNAGARCLANDLKSLGIAVPMIHPGVVRLYIHSPQALNLFDALWQRLRAGLGIRASTSNSMPLVLRLLYTGTSCIWCASWLLAAISTALGGLSYKY